MRRSSGVAAIAAWLGLGLDPLHSALCNGEMGERDRGERREESEKVKSGIGGTYCKLFVLWSCGVCTVELVADSVLELGGM